MEDIRKTRPQIDSDLWPGLQLQDVATVHEAMGRQGAMTCEIKPIDPGMKICGRALTVRCPAGDNLMLIKAVEMARAGDVIVADMGPIQNNGPFGEVLAVNCMAQHVSGLVLSCGVRDSEAICKLGFPVFSAGISVFGTAKASKGTINHPVVVGGVLVRPGDVVLGDRDGVVVIPWERAAQVLQAADARRAKEQEVMAKLRAGASLFQLYGYQKTMDALGVTEEHVQEG